MRKSAQHVLREVRTEFHNHLILHLHTAPTLAAVEWHQVYRKEEKSKKAASLAFPFSFLDKSVGKSVFEER